MFTRDMQAVGIKSRLRHSLRRGHGRECIAEPVHRSAFDIDATQAVRRAQSRSFIQQRAGLLRIGNVATEQNDPGRPHQPEPRAFQAGELRAAEPNNQQTPRRVPQTCRHPRPFSTCVFSDS